jgi:hypothetical protein
LGKYAVMDWEEVTPSSRPVISRQKLVEIVDEAIEEALDATDMTREQADLILQSEGIRSVIRTTNQIDSNAWKCRDSCGCPLTAAGRVYFTDDDDAKSVDSQSPLVRFYTAFDSKTSAYFRSLPGNSLASDVGVGSITWTVIDE